MKKRFRRVWATLAAMAIGSVGALFLVGVHPASAATPCPSGYGCLYSGVNTNSSVLGYYYYYGVYGLNYVYDNHLMLNQQTGNAWVHLCKAWNGTDCPLAWNQSSLCWINLSERGYVYNFTPINTIKLTP